MLTLFRINDPFRLIIALLLLLAIRLPLILGDWQLLVPELHWMVLGESLNDGKQLYTDIWDFMGPLAAWMYQLIDLAFGRSAFAYHIIAIILVFYQATIFNFALVRRGIYNENNYIPSLLYIVFSSISFDFFTLSPALVANTFLIMVVNKLFALNKRKVFDQEIFRIGVYLGFASLFYLPSLTFIIIGTIGLALFRVTSSRHFGLVLFGLIIVHAIFNILFFFNSNLEAYYSQYISSLLLAGSFSYVSLIDLAWMFIIPGVVLLFSIFKTSSERGFVNFQVACQRLMILWLLPATLAIFFSPVRSSYLLMLFVAPLTFFTTHWCLLVRKRIWSELSFILLTLALLFLCYNGANNYIPEIRKANFSRLFTSPTPEDVKTTEIMVLGQDFNHFLEGNTLATPYFNWILAQRHFNKLNDYQTIATIYKNINSDLPKIIIDEAGVAEILFRRLPVLKEKYRESLQNPKIWKLKEETE